MLTKDEKAELFVKLERCLTADLRWCRDTSIKNFRTVADAINALYEFIEKEL